VINFYQGISKEELILPKVKVKEFKKLKVKDKSNFYLPKR